VYFNRAEMDNKRASSQEPELFNNVAMRLHHRLPSDSYTGSQENFERLRQGLAECTEQVAVDRYVDIIRHNPGISMFGSSPSQVSSTSILTSHEGQ
jgi:hypothetical protein